MKFCYQIVRHVSIKHFNRLFTVNVVYDYTFRFYEIKDNKVVMFIVKHGEEYLMSIIKLVEHSFV